MRLRLFGKLLLAFWLTLLVMNLGLWLLYTIDRTPEGRVVTRAAEPVVMLLAHRVASAGPIAAESERRLLQPLFRDRITIAPLTVQSGRLERDRRQMIRRVIAPTGQPYTIAYRYPPRFDPGPLAIPGRIWLVWVASGLLFSAALVYHLTRPLILLRAAFSRIARGDLQVRLEEKVGRRSDEFADLARDFDFMAVRLNQLVTARDRLLHDVSHELRSPLTRLQLAIALARQDPARRDASLERIAQEAHKLDGLVQELLTLARVESGADSDHAFFDPIAVIDGVRADAELEADAKRCTIAFVAPGVAEDVRPVICGSAELFRRAIENVLRNAIRFSPAASTVQVKVDILEAPSRYRIAISDEGPGVDTELVGRLLEPFVRADRSGTGLGLTIADRAIRAHGGTIACHNREGGGFAVEIEVRAAQSPD